MLLYGANDRNLDRDRFIGGRGGSNNTATHSIPYSPTAMLGRVDMSTSVIDDVPRTPMHDRGDSNRNQARSVLKVYMANQLDLNESEMQYYEDAINEMADKLQRSEDEKDELVSTCTSLGSRLQKLGEEKEEAIKEWQSEKEGIIAQYTDNIAAIQASWDDDKQQYDDDKQRYDDEAREMQAQIDDLTFSLSDSQRVSNVINAPFPFFLTNAPSPLFFFLSNSRLNMK